MNALAAIGSCKRPDGSLGGFSHFGQSEHERVAFQCFSMPEAYGEGRLNIRFLIEWLNHSTRRQIVDHEITDDRYYQVLRKLRFVRMDQGFKLRDRDLDAGANDENVAVFVCLSERFNRVEVLVPARIRLKRVNLLDDLFRGDVHLSSRDGATKSILPFNEREANGLGSLCLTANHPPAKLIKSAAQVMDCVAENQGDHAWNGLICLDVHDTPLRVAVLADSQLEWLLAEKLGNLPVRVVDMLFGPLNFHERAGE